LLAVVFLYAPLAGAAWSSHAMACCTDGYCNIPKHHHQKSPEKSAAAEDCGHHLVHTLVDCSMQCCRNPDKPMISSMAFVLPPAISTTPETQMTRAIARVRALEIPSSIEPLSPPPRTDDLAL
jgi:hypothetical protein